jgi:mannitol-specific phosphotransferase system IIBC component
VIVNQYDERRFHCYRHREHLARMVGLIFCVFPLLIAENGGKMVA